MLNPWRLVLRPEEQEEAIKDTHGGKFASHFGTYKTLRKLQSQYYWPGMARQVTTYVKNCETCKAHKIKTTPPHGLMITPKTVSLPMHTLSMDIVGPLPRSTNGCIYILSVVDIFSKYCWLFPLRKATSESIIKHLENNIFLQFGTPAVIILDNASYFRSKTFKTFTEKYKIPRLFFGCNYAPQSNVVERYNQTIETSLSILVGEDQRKWVNFLGKIQNAINTHINLTTGFSPAYLMYGRELIVDGRYHNIKSFIPENQQEIDIDSRQEFAEGLKTLADTYDVVQEKLLESFKKNAGRYNLRRKTLKLNPGDTVWARNHTLSRKMEYFCSKLAPRYIKCRVVACKSPTAIELEDETGKNKGIYHIKHLFKG